MTEEQAFWTLNVLVDRMCPGYYRYVDIFATLLLTKLTPEIAAHRCMVLC